MAPTKQKPKHIRVVPSWIDEKIIEKLPKEKHAYWERRITGKKDKPKLSKIFKTPDDITIGFDNNGNMVAKTRAMRRQKLPTDPKYTKATHSLKKKRNK